ncbi:unnamed protein product [Urochloa humidicola]
MGSNGNGDNRLVKSTAATTACNKGGIFLPGFRGQQQSQREAGAAAGARCARGARRQRNATRAGRWLWLGQGALGQHGGRPRPRAESGPGRRRGFGPALPQEAAAKHAGIDGSRAHGAAEGARGRREGHSAARTGTPTDRHGGVATRRRQRQAGLHLSSRRRQTKPGSSCMVWSDIASEL